MKHFCLHEAEVPAVLRYLWRVSALFTLLSLSFILHAQGHEPVFPGLTGNELTGRVVDWYKPRRVLDYGTARDVLYGTIYNEKDSVHCVYTGHTLYLPQGVDPSSHLFSNGSSNGINCEHTYPRSKGADEENGNAFSDMHHLFPVQTSVNTARSNLAFGEINDAQSTAWYYLTGVSNRIPSSSIEAYSEKTSSRFEPREEHKGNAARAMFYFFTMYKNEALAADPNFFESQREVLCTWHSQDPVDSLEWERTHLISQYQNGLTNPYVLDSSLVTRAFCNLISSTYDVEEVGVRVYPNPVVDRLTVVARGTNDMRVVDVLGRTLLESRFNEAIEVDLSELQAGTYYVLVGEEAFKLLKL